MNTKTHAGFTLIELMIVVAIIGIISSIVVSTLSGNTSQLFTTTPCKAGYTFSRDVNGYEQQVFDNQGRGIPCQ